MSEARSVASMPTDLKQLVLGYLNTCQVMTRLWFWAAGLLLFALPLGFYGAGKNWVEASVTGGGLWLIFGVISRFLVFEFRQLRAAWVARRIRQRIPAGRERWQAMVRWIAEHNDGNFLNTILKKLGVPPRFSGAYAVPHAETVSSPLRGLDRITESLLGNFDQAEGDGTAQTSVFTTTQTQELRDGEWVTVESSTTSHGNVSPDEAVREAMALLEERVEDRSRGRSGRACGHEAPQETGLPSPGTGRVPAGPGRRPRGRSGPSRSLNAFQVCGA